MSMERGRRRGRCRWRDGAISMRKTCFFRVVRARKHLCMQQTAMAQPHQHSRNNRGSILRRCVG